MKSVRLLICILTVTLIASVALAGASNDKSKKETEEIMKLIGNLNSLEFEKRALAAQKLGDKCCKEAVDCLLKMMKIDVAPRCRIIAAQALAKIGDKDVVDAMRQQAKKDPHKTVRTALAAIADLMVEEEVELVKK